VLRKTNVFCSNCCYHFGGASSDSSLLSPLGRAERSWDSFFYILVVRSDPLGGRVVFFWSREVCTSFFSLKQGSPLGLIFSLARIPPWCPLLSGRCGFGFSPPPQSFECPVLLLFSAWLKTPSSCPQFHILYMCPHCFPQCSCVTEIGPGCRVPLPSTLALTMFHPLFPVSTRANVTLPKFFPYLFFCPPRLLAPVSTGRYIRVSLFFPPFASFLQLLSPFPLPGPPQLPPRPKFFVVPPYSPPPPPYLFLVEVLPISPLPKRAMDALPGGECQRSFVGLDAQIFFPLSYF